MNEKAGPGTPSARLDYLLTELCNRFPGVVSIFSSVPPELALLNAIDQVIKEASIGKPVAWTYQDDANKREPGTGTHVTSKVRMPGWANEEAVYADAPLDVEVEKRDFEAALDFNSEWQTLPHPTIPNQYLEPSTQSAWVAWFAEASRSASGDTSSAAKTFAEAIVSEQANAMTESCVFCGGTEGHTPAHKETCSYVRAKQFLAASRRRV
jgi:hypothetical protein